MKIKIVFLFSLFILLLSGFKAEETPLEKLLKQLAKITANYPQEKVHLHLDKPYYAIGEDIWLKAYLVNAEKNEPSFLSKVMYVDLINDKNQITKKLVMKIENGHANGNIHLVDSLNAGNYRIRAYTNYMRNYDEHFFFEKFITIGNVNDIPNVQKPKEKELDLSLQFFPEGGNLIANIRSKIGVKAVTSDGLGANVSGYIINSNKEKITEFRTEHAGMGALAMMPLANENYKAVIKMADGSLKTFNFPSITNNGYGLAVNALTDQVNIRISGTADLINGNDVFIVAQANGVVYASFASKMDKVNLIANINKNSFPTGIIHFTLFNSLYQPVAERLVFVDHKDALKINIKNSAALTKKKIDLGLSVTDVSNLPIDGDFSVSVTDISKVQIDEDDELSILANLLLTSDLRGYIEQPNYYFNEVNLEREKHLDHLMLTQGWSRFVWQEISKGKEPEIKYRPEQSLEISGKIKNEFEKPLNNARVSLISTTPGLFLKLDTVSNAKGDFLFDLLDFPDSTSFLLQSKMGKDNKNVVLSLNQGQAVMPLKRVGKTIDILPYLQQTKEMYAEEVKYNMRDKGILLKTVNIVAKKPVLVLNVPNSKNTSGTVDRVISRKMLEKEINIFNALRKIPGVKVGLNDGVSLQRTGGFKPLPAMVVILDGTPVDQSVLKSISINDIEGIEVLTSMYNLTVYGLDGLGGVMHVTTRKGAAPPTPATNTAKIKDFGYSMVKEFYAPNYEDPKVNQQIFDLRSTIYWNPNVKTNEKGVASFSFFNAGKPGTYRVIIEGMDNFGNIGRKTFTYDVTQLN
jgi:hypothetical protein